jgi:hypothetical protein
MAGSAAQLDVEGLPDRSKRPPVSPTATRAEIVGKILYLRRHWLWPGYGDPAESRQLSSVSEELTETSPPSRADNAGESRCRLRPGW